MTGRERNSHQTERSAKSRRNKRVKVCFPVTVEVPAGDGRTRVLKARTVVVSHAGATLEVEESIPVEMGVQVTPPFGGTLLAEVSAAWVERTSGRRRVSIRLIDPASWTSPERLAASRREGAEKSKIEIHPGVWQVLTEYTAFLNDTSDDALTPAQAAEKILEEAFLSDVRFQDWFASKIIEDLQAWEEASVLEGAIQ